MQENDLGGMGIRALYAGLNVNVNNDNGDNAVPVPPNGTPIPSRWRNYLPPAALAPGRAALHPHRGA